MPKPSSVAFNSIFSIAAPIDKESQISATLPSESIGSYGVLPFVFITIMTTGACLITLKVLKASGKPNPDLGRRLCSSCSLYNAFSITSSNFDFSSSVKTRNFQGCLFFADGASLAELIIVSICSILTF